MASLLITMAPRPGETGPDTSLPISGLGDDEAVQIANQLRKLLKAWRSPTYTVRDSGGGEICRIDVRRLRAVRIDAELGSPSLPTPACGKSAAANDPQVPA